MLTFLQQVFDVSDFPARWHCGRWSSAHGWLHILSDVAIFGAYAAIPITLVYFVRKRREDIPFPPVFWLFAAFIFACGFGHLVEASIFWIPWYRFSGAIKVCTAAFSWMTVLALAKTLPKALALPGLKKVNKQLAQRIEETRQAEFALRQSEERFSLAVRGSNDGIWDWNILTGEGFFSHRWCQLLGYGPDELEPNIRVLESLLHPDDREMAFIALQTHLLGLAACDFELRLKTKQGDYRWYRARGQAIWDDAGKVLRMAGSLTDVTERKQSERDRESLLSQLRNLNADLEERVRIRTAELSAALKEREVLLQEVHHRVKNNLQVISSLINMQMRHVKKGSSEGALEDCQNRIQAIALIHEELYRSKNYARVPFSNYAANLARNVLRAVGATPKNIELSIEVDEVSFAMDKAIPCGLILNELITNALRHAFPEENRGTVHVGLQRSNESEMELWVGDDGIGMDPDFDPTKSKSLGVQLVQTLVEQLDGRIEIIRQEGTTFRIRFPMDTTSTEHFSA